MAATDTDQALPKAICFMIMPYGIKPTFAEAGNPATINYDILWDKVFLPLIENELGYQAVRADQELGAMIIKEMIERLALSDLVIAEISTPNANVYYEIGVRHAAKEAGCVLISADWSKQNFDLNQIRQVHYPLPEGSINNETAAAAMESLKTSVATMINGTSPVFECLPGFPGKVDKAQFATFRKQMDSLSAFSAELRSIRLLPREQREGPATQVVNKYRKLTGALPVISMEIISLLKDNAHWEAVVEFIDSLPEVIKSSPIVQEQRFLAQSKDGKHLRAIASLEELINRFGDTAERRGLIGGRYKELFNETKDPQYLSKAITSYDLGMQLDLNNYYCSSNLARLYRSRGRAGDDEKAKLAANITILACERAKKINPSDEWILPALLAAAFDAGDVVKAQELFNEMSDTGIQPFKLDSVMGDLGIAIDLQKDEATKLALQNIVANMKKLK